MDQINYSYLQGFEAQLRARELQPQSIRTYCTDIQQYLEWLTECDLASPLVAGTQDAQKYVAFLSLPIHTQRTGKIASYSPSTIARKIKTLRYFYDFLSESEDK
jgi:site-specific recombinase XerD